MSAWAQIGRGAGQTAAPRPRPRRLLATKQRQREIGAQLYLSLNTVKAHTRNIFRELEVSSRTGAVARARELGLI